MKDVTPTAIATVEPPKRPRGFPPRELTPEIMEVVRKALLAGCKHETTAHLAGIGVRTFYEWRRKGEEPEYNRSKFGDFARMVRAAEAEAQRMLSATIMLGVRKNPKLALEMLQARWPRLWPQKPTVTNEVNNTIEVEVTDGELTRRLDSLVARHRARSGTNGTNGRLKPGP